MHKKPLMPAALLALSMTLAACASHTPETSPGTLTSSGKPAVCLSLMHITPNRGKPGGATTEDVSAALDRDHPIERVRNVVGDNDSTLLQIDKNNASIDSLCGGSGGVR